MAVTAIYIAKRDCPIKAPTLRLGDIEAIGAQRLAIAAALDTRYDDGPARKWTTRYAVWRIAWHNLDDAWEMEDRTE
jgi:hypothetical protein